MGKHFTAEFKLEAAKLVVDHGYTFEVHRSSYRHWQASANEPDGERVVNRSRVMEAWNASGGSAGARSIATIVTSSSGVKMGRWLAGKLMKELGIASYRLTNTNAAAMNTLKYRTISTASSRLPRRIKSGAEM